MLAVEIIDTNLTIESVCRRKASIALPSFARRASKPRRVRYSGHDSGVYCPLRHCKGSQSQAHLSKLSYKKVMVCALAQKALTWDRVERVTDKVSSSTLVEQHAELVARDTESIPGESPATQEANKHRVHDQRPDTGSPDTLLLSNTRRLAERLDIVGHASESKKPRSNTESPARVSTSVERTRKCIGIDTPELVSHRREERSNLFVEKGPEVLMTAETEQREEVLVRKRLDGSELDFEQVALAASRLSIYCIWSGMTRTKGSYQHSGSAVVC